MGNELALDVNLIYWLMLGLFFVCLPVGRGEIRRARARALEAEVAAAVVSAAEAVIAAAEVRLLREHPELFT
ncbi:MULTISPECIES: hypothetical protein [unclassified Mycobacterium]|uniref:hypothetical protein n=1 Tax=unclassified Mycobacterium TaxID=2642494 RepID=UPI00096F5DD8|nr:MULTISPECIES: hypothetical protein [unclassified Mycobacterium]OMC21569.1 hypothetical protein A5736_11110 [Mycobacterium sp. SP-6446]OMC53679.1 hypothetical protein A5747_19530 [Mycobacterium sp. IS-836]